VQSGVVAVAAGGFHSVALLGSGTVVVWGSNDANQSFIAPGATEWEVTAIAAGLWHTLALGGELIP
jgi:hypothetical protein